MPASEFPFNCVLSLQVFVHNSGKTDGFGKPFGFMKVMSTGNGVNLILMPYNYPVLVQLLQELKVCYNIVSIFLLKLLD